MLEHDSDRVSACKITTWSRIGLHGLVYCKGFTVPARHPHPKIYRVLPPLVACVAPAIQTTPLENKVTTTGITPVISTLHL